MTESDRNIGWIRKALLKGQKEGRAKFDDIQQIDFEAFYDSSLTYAENKTFFDSEYLFEEIEVPKNYNANNEEKEILLKSIEDLKKQTIEPKPVNIGIFHAYKLVHRSGITGYKHHENKLKRQAVQEADLARKDKQLNLRILQTQLAILKA